MHFFYLDETGCTGADLKNVEQAIFVLGGISVNATGWRKTIDQFRAAIDEFFGEIASADFELHATDILNQKGAFAEYDRSTINDFMHRVLDVIIERKHAIHFVGIDKAKLAEALPGGGHRVVKCEIPYLLGFNYMVSYIERYTREALGRTVRSMIILDQKDAYHADIDEITNYRRYEIAKARRLKQLVEFSYSIDSVRHPMVQVSDLVIFLIRKFLEVENDYRKDWSHDAKNFYAGCYDKIIERVKWRGPIAVTGREEKGAHDLLASAFCTHRPQWRRHYVLP